MPVQVPEEGPSGAPQDFSGFPLPGAYSPPGQLPGGFPGWAPPLMRFPPQPTRYLEDIPEGLYGEGRGGGPPPPPGPPGGAGPGPGPSPSPSGFFGFGGQAPGG